MREFIQKSRAGFSMVELVFMIVVLGIVSSIGAEIIAQVYKNYVLQRVQYKANIKTELALLQIANRLHYAIPGTVGYRKESTSDPFISITELSDENSTVLQWVGADGDGFEAIESDSNRRPGWSAFIDIDSNETNSTTLSTPGSNLDLEKEIISNLGGDIGDAAIYFPDGSEYNISDGRGESITLDTPIPSGADIWERYKLAWSSYALVIEGGDLYLYYNFAPNRGTDISGGKLKKSLLLKNISNFRFTGGEGSMRIKICKEERIDKDLNISSCKEKVVF